jgi:putative heme-binding domain-containing protein
LAVKFGDLKGIHAIRAVLANQSANLADREAALHALASAKDAGLAKVLHDLLAEPPLRSAALKALAAIGDLDTPARILAAYGSFSPAEKRDALATLASRAAFGKALLDSVASKRIAATEIPADLVRQLRSLGDAELDRRIAEVWGIVRATPEEKSRLMEVYRKKLIGPGKPADLALGRAIYAKTCQQCHVLFGTGGNVGPEITGANRGDLNYLLENVLDPSAVIPKEYTVTLIELKNGRLISGIVRGESDSALTVVTADDTLTVAKADIEARRATDQSMMPDDQMKPFSDGELRALFAYLQSPRQVPMMATPENATGFFNGKDLSNWEGNGQLWSVQKGEIVGKSGGLKSNEFLKSQMEASDFRIRLQVKLSPDSENSGIQFRSEALPGGDVKGLQADIGAGWWGKLYEEHGRGILSDKSGEPFVKANDWNDYVIEAVGPRVRTWINGQLCADVEDAKAARRGIFALQLHSGGPMEVRFRNLKLEVRSPAASQGK